MAVLVSRYRRLDLAEDALAEAFATATHQWREHGIPHSPGAWLLTVARRRVLDRLKAEAIAARKKPLLVVDSRTREAITAHRVDPGDLVPDDQLRMILLCCHPALSLEASSALALRLVIGLSTVDIARLFLVPEPTVAARITRAKRKISLAGMPFATPDSGQLGVRVERVADVAYLAFTAGYVPGPGTDLLRSDLAGEAIRLLRVTCDVAGSSPLLDAQLALMLLQHARRDARVDAKDQGLVLLSDQDRRLWHREEITEGLRLLEPYVRHTPTAPAGARVLEALIAAEHAVSARAADTRWDRIAGYYADLEVLTASPVVRLNRAVAVAEAKGPTAGLALLDGIEGVLANSHRLYAVRGELLRRSGDLAAARTAYERAVDRCTNDVELLHLRGRLGQIDALG